VVASDAHRFAPGGLKFDDLESTRKYRAFRTYGRTKLMNILFTRELARRLEGTGVTANAVHPGFVATRFGDGDTGFMVTSAWCSAACSHTARDRRANVDLRRAVASARRRHYQYSPSRAGQAGGDGLRRRGRGRLWDERGDGRRHTLKVVGAGAPVPRSPASPRARYPASWPIGADGQPARACPIGRKPEQHEHIRSLRARLEGSTDRALPR
jgi:NAD(P)-dependent dehydrogenase (short-subunit alcohol dehydrogenase family)